MFQPAPPPKESALGGQVAFDAYRTAERRNLHRQLVDRLQHGARPTDVSHLTNVARVPYAAPPKAARGPALGLRERLCQTSAEVFRTLHPGAAAVAPPSTVPPEYAIFEPTTTPLDPARGETRRAVFPTAMPSSRAEVLALADAMDRMRAAVEDRHRPGQPAPAAPLFARPLVPFQPQSAEQALIHDHLCVVDIVFSELVRQVLVGCTERGALLEHVRQCLAAYVASVSRFQEEAAEARREAEAHAADAEARAAQLADDADELQRRIAELENEVKQHQRLHMVRSVQQARESVLRKAAHAQRLSQAVGARGAQPTGSTSGAFAADPPEPTDVIRKAAAEISMARRNSVIIAEESRRSGSLLPRRSTVASLAPRPTADAATDCDDLPASGLHRTSSKNSRHSSFRSARSSSPRLSPRQSPRNAGPSGKANTAAATPRPVTPNAVLLHLPGVQTLQVDEAAGAAGSQWDAVVEQVGRQLSVPGVASQPDAPSNSAPAAPPPPPAASSGAEVATQFDGVPRPVSFAVDAAVQVERESTDAAVAAALPPPDAPAAVGTADAEVQTVDEATPPRGALDSLEQSAAAVPGSLLRPTESSHDLASSSMVAGVSFRLPPIGGADPSSPRLRRSGTHSQLGASPPSATALDTALQRLDLGKAHARSGRWMMTALLEISAHGASNDAAAAQVADVSAVAVSYFKNKYGLDKMAEGYLADFAVTARSLAAANRWVHTFVQFVGMARMCGVAALSDMYTPRAFQLYLACMSAVRRRANKAQLKQLMDTQQLVVSAAFAAAVLDAVFGKRLPPTHVELLRAALAPVVARVVAAQPPLPPTDAAALRIVLPIAHPLVKASKVLLPLSDMFALDRGGAAPVDQPSSAALDAWPLDVLIDALVVNYDTVIVALAKDAAAATGASTDSLDDALGTSFSM